LILLDPSHSASSGRAPHHFLTLAAIL
jgi:hypothetical protein